LLSVSIGSWPAIPLLMKNATRALMLAQCHRSTIVPAVAELSHVSRADALERMKLRILHHGPNFRSSKALLFPQQFRSDILVSSSARNLRLFVAYWLARLLVRVARSLDLAHFRLREKVEIIIF
jgi:hypothetical protein